MAPPSADVDTAVSPEHHVSQKNGNTKTATSSFPTPLKYSGSLDEYEHFDVAGVIGREFPKVQLSELLKDDAKIRDLAITGEKRSFLCHDDEPGN